MNPINAHKLLETMHELTQVANKQSQPTEGQGEFGSMLMSAIDKVNDLKMNAGELAAKYEQGDTSVELTDVMISMQKSSVSFQALTQVRNRLVNAYQDIMNMQI